MHSAAPLIPRTPLHALLLLGTWLLHAGTAYGFGFDELATKARQLSTKSWQKPAGAMPKALADLTYDQYRDIRFKSANNWWRDAKLPFEVAFFHQGQHFSTPVRINEIVGRKVQEIRFDPSQFDYGRNNIAPQDLKGIGFAGFRVHYPINIAEYKDEVVSFLGASYFRALGKNQHYGVSARGLALDTATQGGEEFPQFVEYWLQRPAKGAKEMIIFALLDSPRATGAYRFTVRPGVQTAVDVRSQLFMRDKVAKAGVAPLTSMYFFGENQRSASEDYRPEVHDSDGLSVLTAGGEWLWRPLVNPKRLLVTSFAMTNPRGFGMMQRDREFNNYQDLEAQYEARPSAWIEPKGDWGSGRVELVQIPTPDETNDNIVAYWVPDQPPRPGVPLNYEYRILWQRDIETRPPTSWVAQTRRGHGFVKRADDSIALFVDFEGPALKTLTSADNVDAAITVDGNAKLLETTTRRNDHTGGWRTAIRLRRLDEKKPVELRAHLHIHSTVLSETWSHILPPE